VGGYTAAHRMPARRPYASRGVPRRRTTRKTGRRASLFGAAAALGVVGALVLGVLFLTQPNGPLAPTAAGLAGGASGGAAAGAEAAGLLQMATVSAPEATALAANGTNGGNGDGSAGARPTASPASLPTARRWDNGAAGVVSDAALVSQLDQALLGVDGHVGLAVKDLASGRGAVLDGDRELQAASLYKLPVLYTVFDVGLSMGEALPITDEARTYDAGTLELGTGETLSVAEALERMVVLSDNTSAVMLGSRVGGTRINAEIAALGLDTTHYSLDRMTTSALDMLHLLELVARGKAVSPAASADMVHLLLRQRVNDRLPRLLPDGVQVAHKTGNLPGIVNDVGLLYGPSNTIAVAALVTDTTDEAAAATAIARAALAAYTYFDAQPEAPGRPTIPRAPTRSIPPIWREPRPVPTATPTLPPTVTPLEVVEPTPSATPVVAATPVPSAATPVAAATPVPSVPATTPPTPAPNRQPTSAPPAATAVPTSAPPQPTATNPAAAATRAPTAAPATTTTAPTATRR
jgi:beta-lactamase class A